MSRWGYLSNQTLAVKLKNMIRLVGGYMSPSTYKKREAKQKKDGSVCRKEYKAGHGNQSGSQCKVPVVRFKMVNRKRTEEVDRSF